MMKITTINFNPVVGDIVNNVNKMISLAKAADDKSELIVFGECATVGYIPEDLLFRPDFVDTAEKETARFIHETADLKTPVIFGSIEKAQVGAYNVGIVSHNGGIRVMNRKHMRANGYVFDEIRTFKRGELSDIRTIRIGNERVGVIVCEDTWHPDVIAEHKRQGATLIVSINGSPYEQNKVPVRVNVCKQRFEESGIPIVYATIVGGQDHIVFDGGSFLYNGEVCDHTPLFTEGTFVLDFNNNNPFPIIDDRQTNYQASVYGLRDFFHKQGVSKAVLGYSGGVDSGIVAAMAVDAFGPENVTLVSLPSGYSSEHSKSDALDGAKRLGAPFRMIDIEPVVESLRAAYRWTRVYDDTYDAANVEVLKKNLTGTADENIQARARGVILMSISNQEGSMVLTTGNRSETSVGYFTLYGDSCGAYNPIQDYYKSYLFEVARWRNSITQAEVDNLGFLGKGDIEIIPESIISKPPSAELRPDQKDEDSLPPYPVLDEILRNLIDRNKSVDDVVALGNDRETVVRINNLIYSAEGKRRQTAIGTRISNHLFNKDRRYPIVNKWR